MIGAEGATAIAKALQQNAVLMRRHIALLYCSIADAHQAQEETISTALKSLLRGQQDRL